MTYEVQRKVEAAGGDLIAFFTKDKEDLNALFGKNPCPGQPKELRIKYISIGNDADRMTTTEELTTRGFQRNFIKNFDGEVGIPVSTYNHATGSCRQGASCHKTSSSLMTTRW